MTEGKFLLESDQIWGSYDLFESDPALIKLNKAIYIPLGPKGPWGIYHENGRIVPGAIDYRERRHAPIGQEIEQCDFSNLSNIDTIYDCYYGGRIQRHYGHFLINTLPRFWYINQQKAKKFKILVHSDTCIEDCFKLPFISESFSALKLTPEDFIIPNGPVRLNNILIPYTSIEEQSAGYRAYADMCRDIGDIILSKYKVKLTDSPIYLSKSKMKIGVSKIINELEIEKFLSAQGVQVIDTTQFRKFGDQLFLMASHNYILGSVGSALHTNIFVPNRNILGLASNPLNSNYKIIDALSEAKGRYYRPREEQEVIGQIGIQRTIVIPNAEEVAKELIDILYSSDN